MKLIDLQVICQCANPSKLTCKQSSIGLIPVETFLFIQRQNKRSNRLQIRQHIFIKDHGSGWKDSVPVSKRPGSGNAAESRRKRPPEVETFLIKFPELRHNRIRIPSRQPSDVRRAALRQAAVEQGQRRCNNRLLALHVGALEEWSRRAVSRRALTIVEEYSGVRVR
ncbi:hypothetical protein E3N88_34666 [Mikania micrantha]|uniref:Uncharacterized protein n=1 Tax=Mikania micrantha TaxID=192012 RepID=A0A5N6LZM5_9ASTR|nr:hypothetical protein E3N88_34666 [Mikania micrantha]